MLISTGMEGEERRSAEFLFDLARNCQQQYHAAKARRDGETATVLSIFKASCLFLAKHLADDRVTVKPAVDQTHRRLLTVLHRDLMQDLHSPREFWDTLTQMRDDNLDGGLAA